MSLINSVAFIRCWFQLIVVTICHLIWCSFLKNHSTAPVWRKRCHISGSKGPEKKVIPVKPYIWSDKYLRGWKLGLHLKTAGFKCDNHYALCYSMAVLHIDAKTNDHHFVDDIFKIIFLYENSSCDDSNFTKVCPSFKPTINQQWLR